MSTSEPKPDATKSTPAEGNDKKKSGKKIFNNTNRSTKFEGRCAKLKGHVYEYGESKNVDQFVLTTKEIQTYVGRTYKNGGDTSIAVEFLRKTEIEEPEEPADTESFIQKKKWERAYDIYTKRITTNEENIQALFSLVWGQCSESMQQKIESLPSFAEIKQERDGIELLIAIKNTSYDFQSQKYRLESLNEALVRLLNFRQGQYMTPHQYYEQFLNLVDVYNHLGGWQEPEPGALEHVCKVNNWDADALTEGQKDQVLEMSRANLFIIHADRSRYGALITDLQNDFLTGRNNYPTTVTEAYNRLTNWKEAKATSRNTNTGGSGVSFTNVGKSGKGQKDKSKITCFKCQEKGHYASECTNEKVDGTTHVTDAEADGQGGTENEEGTQLASRTISTQPNHHGNILTTNMSHCSIPSTWVLLDNQSTIDVFCNEKLLTDIQETNKCMNIHCNAGVKQTCKVGILQGYGEVWYHPTGIANILSLSGARLKGCLVEYDTKKNCFMLHTSGGNKHIFHQSPQGLYYLDMNAETLQGHTLVNTVSKNKLRFSNRDYLRAVAARNLLKNIGRPSQKTFLQIIDRNLLPNCPVTHRDAVNAELIFGADVGSLKGKTTRQSSTPIVPVLNDLPSDIMSQYRDVTMTGDIFFVNKIMFFVTRSRHIQFTTVEHVLNRKPETIMKAFVSARNVYLRRGFNVTHVITDGEFECLRGDLSTLHITLNTASHDEHVPDIERHIRTIKERTRCTYNTLPFTKMPDRIIIEMVYASVFWLNCFPPESGISDVLSPRAIVTGETIDFNRHCQLEFGAYVQTHEDHDNSMIPRTVGALALRPTGNLQGGYYFFSLNTGRVLNRNHWTVLPIPAEVIQRVHALARRNPRGMLFSNREQQPFVLDPDVMDDDDDSTYYPEDELSINDAPAGVNDDADDVNFVDFENENAEDNDSDGSDEDNDGSDEDDSDEDEDNDDNADEDADEDGNDIGNNNDIADDDEPPIIDFENDPAPINDDDDIPDEASVASSVHDIAGVPPNNIAGVPPDDVHADLEEEMNRKYGVRQSGHNLRRRKARGYGHLHAVLKEFNMTQYSVNQGIKVFGKRGTDAVVQELQQLHDRKVIIPVKASSLSHEEKKAALSYLMFLKQKRCGKIKGRGCADGRKQRTTLSKEEVSSPTVAVESTMLSCTIDAKEDRDVGIVDIPGAFMQVDMDDIVHMRIDGTMAELLLQIDPEYYGQYVETVKGKKIIYVVVAKALYGTLKAALLFWRKLSDVLQSWGFKINPYDSCVANKMIDGKQCTILWHVDDLKISHVDKNVVTSIIEKLSGEFGKEAPLTIKRGRVHDYLGMTLDYTEKGKVKIIMKDYIEGILSEMPESMSGVSPTPAAHHLFNVNPDGEKLDAKDKEFFHHVVAQLLFLCKRARPDIQTAVSFLCTRVQHPDTDDYKKLGRVIKYLRGTKNLPLRLEASSLHKASWWVDASYAVHPDMKSHTGGILSLGKGAIYGTSTRQKINAKSSTEAELIGVADVLPQALWTRYFLEAQGYKHDDSVIYQDNKSAILLEKNGRASSSKRTRHIDIRYYFITDRIAQGETRVEYCPTAEMVADFFTKPLQGAAFANFRDFILNVDPAVDHITEDHRSVLKDVKTSTKNEGKNEDDEGDFVMVTRKLAHTTKREKNSRVVKQKGLTHVGDDRLNRQVGFMVPNKNPNQQKKTTKQSHFI